MFRNSKCTFSWHWRLKKRRGESPATIVPLALPLTQQMVLLRSVFRASFQMVHTRLANGGHTANNRCIQEASWKHSTTWWSAQRNISAHSAHIAYGHFQHYMCIAHPAHLMLQVLLYTATFNAIHEQQFTSVLPLLSLIINLLCIKVLVTNNYSNP